VSAMGVLAPPLRLGTRRSALALAQSRWVAAALTARSGRDVTLVELTTRGDADPAALDVIGGTGVFVTGIRERLLAGEVDLAVHSLKDLPTAPASDLVLAAVPVRADPRDALVASGGRTLAELPPGARVGTGSPRRAAQLRALGFGLDVRAVRGNVDTRLARVADGTLDGVILARAGLLRLGRDDEITEILDPGQLLPAPGQGALAVECRAADADLTALLAGLDDPRSRFAVTAERGLLAALEAGCTAPVGALADVADADADADVADADAPPELYLRAAVVSSDGARTIRLSITGPTADAAGLGRRLAGDLLDAGAADLIGESR